MLSPFIVNDSPVHLHRFPLAQVNRSLQAWDAADEYIINHLKDSGTLERPLNIVIFNDSFGALTLNLTEHTLQLVNDSYISQQGIKYNLADNNLDHSKVSLLSSIDDISQPVDLVLLKIPKTNSLLEFQLQQIQQIASKETQVIAAARAKDIHTSTLKLFAKHLGETTTSLAVKKARLVFSKVDNAKKTAPIADKVWPLPGFDMHISNQANVFSRDSIDIGGAFLLQHLPTLKAGDQVADLGCGNGILGLALLAQNDGIKMGFFDESHMAISSAKQNVMNNLPEQLSNCRFVVGDCLEGCPENSLDLVVCNPPFHQQQAVTDHIAWQMFKECYKTLKKGGELRIIGNRQLGYHIKLMRLFNNCQTLASNKKFVILSAKK
ncbi:methyltransferase domain-containing protein [Thalassotalea sp. HSM 43]|uniref:methyltransferase n=1 Tax=Thalassotalea sp. HSM 43 TaxID=2552945 RepID=UPI0010804C4C|nr:methyltransferase [Thalassotalea sp. HSM 43]QBY05116.1 methyltransferase domain-containing protein [Thalassotalea sp. HSM 43]